MARQVAINFHPSTLTLTRFSTKIHLVWRKVSESGVVSECVVAKRIALHSCLKPFSHWCCSHQKLDIDVKTSLSTSILTRDPIDNVNKMTQSIPDVNPQDVKNFDMYHQCENRFSQMPVTLETRCVMSKDAPSQCEPPV